MSIAGLVLAAGAGVRAGGPKALRREPIGPEGPVSDVPGTAADAAAEGEAGSKTGRAWVEIAASSLRDAGCAPVIVVLGAAAQLARDLVPEWARVVVCEDWETGQSASLRAGLDALETLPAGETADAVLVTLVDLPWQGAHEALAVAGLVDAKLPRASLARLIDAEGAPGHPVLIGRDHWGPMRDTLSGDEGARRYLTAAGARTVKVEFTADAERRAEGKTASSPRAARAGSLNEGRDRNAHRGNP